MLFICKYHFYVLFSYPMTNSNVFDILEVFEKSNNILFPIDMRIDFDAFCSAFIIKEFFKIKYIASLF